MDTIQFRVPGNTDIKEAIDVFSLLRKSNPKLLPRIWHQRVASVYADEINRGDTEFFVTKDYTSDIVNVDHPDNHRRISDAIDNLREPVSHMSEHDKQSILAHVKLLCDMSIRIVQPRAH